MGWLSPDATARDAKEWRRSCLRGSERWGVALIFDQIDAQFLEAGGRRFRPGVVDADGAGESGLLSYRLEPLEADCKPVAIRPVLDPVRQMQGLAIQLLEGFQHRTVLLIEQSVRDM